MVHRTEGSEIEFRFFRPDARQVFLVGDFNGWHESACPMVRAEGAWWIVRLRLSPGTYQFKYLADNTWYLDFAAFGLEPGPWGWNSVLYVNDPLEDLSVYDYSQDKAHWTADAGAEGLVPV